MFSLESFYSVLYSNLLRPANFYYKYFYPFGETDPQKLINGPLPNLNEFTFNNVYEYMLSHNCYYYDQEPMLKDKLDVLELCLNFKNNCAQYCTLISNSEKSEDKKAFIKQNQAVDWYYFFHGFASLYWFNDFRYYNLDYMRPNKIFISLNHLVTNDRSYRLNLMANLIEKDIVRKGITSLHLKDGENTWIKEVTNYDSKLSKEAKIKIYKNLSQLKGKSLIADYQNIIGAFSAKVGNAEIINGKNALWHVVTETVFYYSKLHLTEKIFKPITLKRPFMLVAAPGNLEYLKSYGFKTFDKWIDESYDHEQDNDRRIEKITAELQKLSSMSLKQINEMYDDMQDILEYNYTHFFTTFKQLIVNELVDNFKNACNIYNHGLLNYRYIIPTQNIDFNKVKLILAQ